MDEQRTRRAALLLEHNRPAEAEKELRAHLSQAPHDLHALLLLSHSLTVQDKDKEAIEVAKQAVATAPDLDTAHYHLAKYWMERQSLEQTMYHLEKGFELMPQLGSAQVMINVLLSAGLPDQAASVLADLRKLNRRS